MVVGTLDDRSDEADERVLRLPPETSRLREARRFVAEAVAACGEEPAQAATLMASEAVTNAMLHARTEVSVRVRCTEVRVVVEVHDGSSVRPEAQPRNRQQPGGLGLHIIDALASRWGVTEIDDDGKVVWFEVSLVA